MPLSLMCGPLSKNADSSANQPLGDLLGVLREALEGSGGSLGGSGTALERLLEAFKRHLAQKAVSVLSTIFWTILKKNGNLGAPSWRPFMFKNRIFWVCKRVSKTRPI